MYIPIFFFQAEDGIRDRSPSRGLGYLYKEQVTDSPRTYTVDIQPADAPWVHRFFGTVISKLAFAQQDNLIKCTASLMPRKAFINSRVLGAVNSGTTLTLDQTSGLLAGDSILILQKEDGYTTVQTHIIDSTTDETTLVVTSAFNAQVDVDDIVVIKRATATYDQDLELTWLGGTAISTGDDIDNTAAENFEDFSIDFTNETEQRWFGGKTAAARYPGDVLTKGYTGEGKIAKFYDSESKLDKARSNDKLAVRFLFEGETALSANSAVAAYSTWGTTNGFRVTATTAGKAGNDISVTLVIAADDNLAASKSGNTITVALANATSSKNTGTLIAAAIEALSGVEGDAEGDGSEEFTAAEPSANLGFKSSGTNVVGRDASEKSYLQIDLADVRINPFFPSASEDSILQQEVPFTIYKDTLGDLRKNWSTRVFLVNDVTSY